MDFLRKSKKLEWTVHSKAKMRQYGLTESRVRRVIHTPLRVEEGIAEDTIAVMQPASVKKSVGGKPSLWGHEIWVMIVEKKTTRRVISAWRYPGVTKPGAPLPVAIVDEINEALS
ncbi:MAG: hypothetical protein AAB495_02145 [Patescibacteria group bacterium]